MPANKAVTIALHEDDKPFGGAQLRFSKDPLSRKWDGEAENEVMLHCCCAPVDDSQAKLRFAIHLCLRLAKGRWIDL